MSASPFYDDIAEYYDLIYADWEDSMRRQGAAISEMLQPLGGSRRAGGLRVLDVAAGIVTFRRLYLPEELRGTGAGKLLMDWAVDWSREHGFRRVEF